MSGGSHQLSEALQLLVSDFESVPDTDDGIAMDQGEFLKLIEILKTLKSLAANLELEVRFLRDMEAGHEMLTFLDSEATSQLADLLPAKDGNIIRPAFGKGGRS